jgi:hypothetical protein
MASLSSLRPALVAIPLLLLSAALAAQEPVTEEKTVFVAAQQSFTPGFAVGDIAIAEPEIADYKVLRGRKELLLYGKAAGTTTLILWDQRRVKRAVITIHVVTRESVQAEKDLTELVAEFPDVKVRRLKGQLVLTGTVDNASDLEALQKIADTAEAANLVRLSGNAGSAAAPAVPEAPTATNPTTPAPTAAQTTTIEYDVDVLEAALAYSSGSYATGVEPSGRSLFRTKVSVAPGARADVYVPGTAIASSDAGKDAKSKKGKNGQPPAPVGIKLTLQPSQFAEDGSFTTVIMVETNVPVEGASDPSITRRARWEMPLAATEPFGLAGAELLAVPTIEQGGSSVGRVLSAASIVSGLPGVSSAPGVGYVGSVPYYSKERKTQLLALFHPRVVRGAKQ